MRVLLYDIETSPILGYSWGRFEVNLVHVIEESRIISVAWKWLGDKEIHCLALPSFPGYKKDPKNNKQLVQALHKLISKADIAVGHNVDNFDDKTSNAAFIEHNLIPPPPHKTIDTLKVARSRFRFSSNKLDELGIRLKVGRKVETGGFSLWKGCMDGSMRAWARMKKYNMGDVSLLERVYLKLRPWMKNHPDMNARDRHTGCPVCRSTNLAKNGLMATHRGVKQRYLCRDCGKSCITKMIGRTEVYA